MLSVLLVELQIPKEKVGYGARILREVGRDDEEKE